MTTFEIEFTRTFNEQHTANATGSIQRAMEKLAPTKDDSGRATFSEQASNLEEGLAKHGVYNLHEVYKVKDLYIQTRARKEGAYPKALVHYSRVFNSVVNKALRVKAVSLSIADAQDYDRELSELNDLHGEEFYPQERIGDQWLPCTLESIAFVDDEQANTWTSTESEPYAGTSFLEMI
jgi:hypothetical protein